MRPEQVTVILDLQSAEIHYIYTVKWAALGIARGAEHSTHFNCRLDAVEFARNVLVESDWVELEERKIYTLKDK